LKKGDSVKGSLFQRIQKRVLGETMSDRKEWRRILLIAFLIGAILCLHYLTPSKLRYQHAVYRIFFYLPLILGGFWFGMKGTLFVSGTVVVFYLLYLLDQWKGLSFELFDTFLEMGIYLVIAFVIGYLVEQERKERLELVRTGSLAAVGTAVAEVAHDMKTPLIAIGGLAAQVSRELRPDDPDQKKLGLVIQETARLESMVKEMLEFGRSMALQTAKTDLNDLILEVTSTTQGMAKSAKVELETDLDMSLPFLMLDAPRIKQVLLNLVTNALQASPPGERVRVRTHGGRRKVDLEVSDSGPGIREKDREKIFTPFFSTKGGGTGLGLAIVKKIVEAHGGKVFFHPNPGKGVTFVVQFPFLG
jgi:two-component system sensor histidine kinase HydH